MKDEYNNLRDELIRWQERRFTVLSASAALVTAILGFEIAKTPTKENWPLISSVLLLLLSCANAFTWYAGVGNSKIGTYLRVFHEEKAASQSSRGWESRLADFNKASWINLNVNHFFAAIYLVLGFISTVVPYVASGYEPSHDKVLPLLLGAGLFFILSLLGLVFFSYPRNRHLAKWRRIRTEEENKAKEESA